MYQMVSTIFLQLLDICIFQVVVDFQSAHA